VISIIIAQYYTVNFSLKNFIAKIKFLFESFSIRYHRK
jgi:hypothetical protein